MNITFLIGNGFDLNAGLETTYTAFLKYYTSTLETDTDPIKYFKQVILKDAKMWSNAEMAFGAATKQFEEDGYSAEDFCVCHEDFCVQLAKYLKKQEQRLHYTALKEVITKGFASGVQSYRKGFRDTETEALRSSENEFGGAYTYNVITFNYTALIGICYQFLKHSPSSLLGSRVFNHTRYEGACGDLIYAHGNVDSDMVLGVNDASQITAPSLFDGYDDIFINQIIKQKQTRSMVEIWIKRRLICLKRAI
jgi:hypothetical protein